MEEVGVVGPANIYLESKDYSCITFVWKETEKVAKVVQVCASLGTGTPGAQ